MPVLLAETFDISQALAKEQGLAPGVYEVRLNLVSPITQEQLNELHDGLLAQGVQVLGRIEQRVKGLHQVSIKFRKPAPTGSISVAPALVALLPTFIVALLIGIGIFKIADITRLALILGGFTVLILFMVRKPLGVAAESYARR